MGTASSRNDLTAIREEVKKNETHYLALLKEGQKASLSSLPEFQSWVAGRMRQIGLQVEEFVVGREELANQPAFQKMLRDNPSGIRAGAPNIVGKSAGRNAEGGLLLFAHPDKFPETYVWGREHPEIVERDGRLYGPGIADDVAGVTAMLGAVEAFRRLGFEQKHNLLVASALGKQLSVCGTYGLMTRYGPLESAIYVHPHESGGGLNQIHMTTAGQVEFLIEIEVKASDSTDHFKAVYSKSSPNAAEKGVYIFRGLHEWALAASKHYRHAGIEKELGGHAFALLVARFAAGAKDTDRHSLDGLADTEAYSIPIRCVLQGTVMFPPDASQETVQAEFERAFEDLVAKDPELAQSEVSLEWGDLIGDSAEADEESVLLRTAFQVLTDVTGKKAYCYYGHALSDTRYPMLYWHAPAVGVGPLCGDIGTESEWVDRKEYLDTIVAVTELLRQLV